MKEEKLYAMKQLHNLVCDDDPYSLPPPPEGMRWVCDSHLPSMMMSYFILEDEEGVRDESSLILRKVK